MKKEKNIKCIGAVSQKSWYYQSWKAVSIYILIEQIIERLWQTSDSSWQFLINPLSPSIHIQILQTDLHTIP